MNQQLFRLLTQDVALFMYEAGINSQPALSYFNDDKGIFDSMFTRHTTHPDILNLKNMSDKVYIQVVGMHAFGNGVYVTAKQLDFNHPVSQFTISEIQEREKLSAKIDELTGVSSN